MSRLRRAGARWRLLVHDIDPKTGLSVRARHLGSDPDGLRGLPDDARAAAKQLRVELTAAGLLTETILPNTEFDELVVGRWLHIEELDAGYWWMNIGGVTVHVTADRDGRPRRVTVSGPDDFAGPVDGCTYQLPWNGGGDGA